jgi:outer membrane biosynthesis protein TonB
MTALEQPLISKIDEAEQRIDGLSQELRAIDDELAGLAARREQYRLLDEACTTLETLAQLGAAESFWGTRFDAAAVDEQLSAARRRIAEYGAQVQIVEDKRFALMNDIKQGSEVLAILEGDLLDAQEEEFQKSLEWSVDREIGPLPDGPALLWVRGGEDDVRLRKALASSLMVAAIAAVLLPLVKLPAIDVMPVEQVPERIVRFIELDHRKPTPPPPIEQPKPQPKEEPLLAEQKSVQPKAAPKPAEEPKPVEPPRQRADTAGILAFRESLATIAERRPAARLGAQARVGNVGESTSGPSRALITSRAQGGSGGINVASLSRDVGGDGGGGGSLDGVDVGRVADAIGGSPGRGSPNGSRTGDGAVAGRTDEEIQIVFDRYKAALYRLYNRELRNDPSLRGQIVLRLTIEPDGSVSMCRLQSTDMNAPALADQVVERVKAFAFGAKDVAAITIVYPIDFLPAA